MSRRELILVQLAYRRLIASYTNHLCTVNAVYLIKTRFLWKWASLQIQDRYGFFKGWVRTLFGTLAIWGGDVLSTIQLFTYFATFEFRKKVDKFNYSTKMGDLSTQEKQISNLIST